NDGQRLFGLGDHGALTNAQYDALEAVRWGGTPFADGRFPTPNGKARLVPVSRGQAEAALKRWPLTLNTGRYRDHWHTMTRSGLSPRLSQHRREPLAEIHPLDAEACGIEERGLVRVATPQGASVFRASLSTGQRRGEVFVPIHWTDRQSSGGRAGLLPRPLVDPHSGQPGFKATPARIEPLAAQWRGFLITREPPARLPALYATRVRVAQGWLVELADDGDPATFAKAVLPKGERVEILDRGRGETRIAIVREGRL